MTERGHVKAILGVALAAALLCLPFLGSLPLFDPDEGYYPAAAAESMDSGHPLDLRLDGEPRWNKPPLSYALMQVSMAAFGRNEFAVRLPSVLEGAVLVALLGLLVARVAGGRAGLLASLVLASSLGFQVLSRAAHPEMGLVLGTAAAQGILALWFVAPAGARPRWAWWAAGLAMGIGFLAKGPTALAMPALMLGAGMLVVPREGRPSWAAAGRVIGGAVLLALAVAAPWYVWMGARHPGFWGAVLGEIGAQAGKEPEGFRASPLFFVPVLVAAFLPWILFLPAGLRGLRRLNPAPAARFALLMALAAGTGFLFWSLSPAKNPHYALVFLPPLAAVAGIRLSEGLEDSRSMAGRSLRVLGWVQVVLGFALLYLLFMTDLARLGGTRQFEFESATGTISWNGRTPMRLGIFRFLSLGGPVLLASGWYILKTPRVHRRVAGVLTAWVLLFWIGFSSCLGPILEARSMRLICRKILTAGDPADHVVVYRKRLPSLSFLLSRQVLRVGDPEGLRRVLDKEGRCWIVLHENDDRVLERDPATAWLQGRVDPVRFTEFGDPLHEGEPYFLQREK